MKSDFLVALTQLAAERDLPREIVLSAIEAALASAYRKDGLASGQNISVKLDPGTGNVSINVLKTIVDEVADPHLEILLADAHKIKPDAELGDSIATGNIPHIAGRIAAQTAKQVVMQRLREAERELIFEEFADKEGEVFSVTVQRIEPKQIIVELGRAEAIVPALELVPNDRYRVGQKFKALLQSVERAGKGPELIVSRADKLLLKRLFEMEVPEIYNGAVEIVAIAREPGARSKVAVRATQDGVDPVGSCVGLRGVRIQNIVNELQGEKIDVVEWNKDPGRFIANALSPAQVIRVELDAQTQSASTIVPDRQLSLAIGREGQNARLAARLTGWNVEIKSNLEADKPGVAVEAPAGPANATSEIESLQLSTRNLNILRQAGITTVGQVLEMAKVDLLAIKGFGEKSYTELDGKLSELNLLLPVVTTEAIEVQPEVEAPVDEAPPDPTSVIQDEEAEEAVETPVTEGEAAEAEAPPQGTAAAEPEVDISETTPEEVPEEKPEISSAPQELVPVFELEEEAGKEPAAAVVEHSSSLRDLPEGIWAVRKASTAAPGQIRFAEDIAGLKGGITARRGRRSDAQQKGRKRRPKASKRR